MIAQELHQVPDITVAENFSLRQLPMRGGRVGWAYVKREARQILDSDHLDYKPNQKRSSLTVAGIQMLEIVRAVHHNANILIMDEPTSAITSKDVGLFERINTLRANGVSIINSSHKMDEVFHLADDISVLRDGQVVSTDRADQIQPDEVIARVVGRKLDQQYPKEELPT